MRRYELILAALGASATLGIAAAALAQSAPERANVRNASEMTFGAIPGTPICLQASPQQGDPMATAFTVLAKAKTGCTVPWHWHSAGETLMIVTGTAQVAMKGEGKPVTLKAGGFASLPAKHAHQMRCMQTCTFYLRSDGKFDIHYVDPQGKEISADQALKSVKETVARK